MSKVQNNKPATKQAEKIKKAAENRKRKPSPLNGQVLPPGFEAHPERRHNGAWKKEDTLRYKLQQIDKMTDTELKELLKDPSAGKYEKLLAKLILGMDSMDAEKLWRVLEGIINQDSGYPKQQVEQHNIELQGILPKPKKRKK